MSDKDEQIIKKQEFVDLVDAFGKIKKNKISRKEVDDHTDLHMQIVIGVIFDPDGRILVHSRASTKKVYPSYIDHVCGAVMSGESEIEATLREAIEETGVKPFDLEVVAKGVNVYNRYRYLVVGYSDGKIGKVDPKEADWVKFIHFDELKKHHASGEMQFVDEFFEDSEIAMLNRKRL